MKRILLLILLFPLFTNAQLSGGYFTGYDRSRANLFFQDHGTVFPLINYNNMDGSVPIPNRYYSHYWTHTGGNQNTSNQDSRNNLTLDNSISRTVGSGSYRLYVEYRDMGGACCQWLRGELGSVPAQNQGSVNDAWGGTSVSIMLPLTHQFDYRRTQIAFDHKENPDDDETPFYLSIRGDRYYIEGRYVSGGGPGGAIDMGPIIRGQWEDWVLIRNWSTSGSGAYMRFYKNGVLMWSLLNVPNHQAFTSQGNSMAPFDRVQHGWYKWAWRTPEGNNEGAPGAGGFATLIMYMDEIAYGKPGCTIADFAIGGSAPPPANVAPVISAGPNVTVYQPATSAFFDGSATDNDGTITSRNWTKVSGPAGGTITNGTTDDMTVTGLTNTGTYVYRYTVVDDDGATSTDDATLTYSPTQSGGNPGACVMFYDPAEATPQVSFGIALDQGYSQYTGATGVLTPPNQFANWSLSSTYARKGTNSYKLHLEKDVTYPPCCGFVASQLMWMSPAQQTIGNAWKYGAVSTFLPTTFQFENRPTVVAYNILGPGDLQPGFQLVTMNGNFYVDGYFVGGPILIGPVVRNQWDDWLMIRDWNTTAAGSVVLKRNGVIVYQKTGINWFSRVGDPAIGRVAHGFFKRVWESPTGNTYGEGTPLAAANAPMDIYIDEIKFGSSCAIESDFVIGGSAPLPSSPRVLVFSRTLGFRHTSIGDGIQAIRDIGTANNFTVTATEDPTMFRLDTLQKFQAVVFLNTTGDVLNGTQQTAFEQYIAGNKGFVGIHSATDTEYGWPWYGQLVGAWFTDHPAIQNATVHRMNTTHPSTATLPNSWSRNDEWYNFGPWQSTVNPLLRVDESTYSGGTEGNPHYISWYHNFGGGRSWYTAMGHTEVSYTEANFVDHLKGGIKWAMGESYSPSAPIVTGEADKSVQLPTSTTTLTATATDPDGNIIGYNWTKVSGPAGGTIANGTTATASISALQAGIYTFRITVTDNTNATAFDDINVNVLAAPAGGNPPNASAGANVSITTSSTTLTSTGSSAFHTIASRLWIKEVGPAATIVSPTAATTSVTGLVTGEYRFKVTITDSLAQTGTDTVHVSVNIPVPNVLPIANAGSSKTITSPASSTTLDGSASDPDGSVASTIWTKVSGTGGVIINSNTAAASVQGLTQGVYVYRLTVTDNRGGVAFSEMQVTVLPPLPPPNQPPIAIATPDAQYITLPRDSLTLSANVYDQDATGYIASASYTFISGPKTPTIVQGTLQGGQYTAKITDMDVKGNYVFRIDVYDNQGLYASDDATVIVLEADVPPPANVPPVISAGPDKIIQFPETSVYLYGLKSDLEDSSNVVTAWKLISGPALGATISDTNKSFLYVTFTKPGIYTFELKGTDTDGESTADRVNVEVRSAYRRKRQLLIFIQSN